MPCASTNEKVRRIRGMIAASLQLIVRLIKILHNSGVPEVEIPPVSWLIYNVVYTASSIREYVTM